MYKIIVVIVKDINDAEIAAKILPHDNHLKRFFVFLDNRPIPSDLLWKTSDDLYIVMEKAINLGDYSLEIALRSGVLYTKADQFIFCMANNIPNKKVINDTFDTLITNYDMNIIQNENLIALNREYILYYGFDAIYEKFKTINSISANSQIDLAQTMSGTPSTIESILTAIKEIVILEKVKILPNNKSNINKEIWEKLTNSVISKTDIKPNIYLYQDIISKTELSFKDELALARMEIPPTGAVIVLTNKEKELEQIAQPFHKFYLLSGESIFIYTHKENVN